MAAGNRLEILSRIESDLKICFNEIELQRIIDNNLSNAIKYAKSSSEILISLSRLGESLLLEFVTESRNPIEDTRKIFEAYHREDEEAEGFGLGLVIVSEICKRHGVKVEVSSNEERTLFRYRFNNRKEDGCEDRTA
ncbi:ATP-binding protein [Nitratifractor salsuginis]|uniref:ATP-binding protein n=1 Tax=Nitratifractor salsuginis TaxID=269261 RepID=UPI00030D6BE1|nr:ATP-binding protein [Nitratifractor salsuginis]